MIRSMTGYGRCTFDVAGASFEVEIRTVNHRHLDVRMRLPKMLAGAEIAMKNRVKSKLQRGKVEMTVSTGAGDAAPPTPVIDRDAVRELVAAAQQLADENGLDDTLRIADVIALPGVVRFVDRVASEEDLVAGMDRALDRALAAVDGMRAAEGEALEREIRARLAAVESLVDAVAERADTVVIAVREKLRRRTQQLELETGLLDEARLHQEIVFAADRLDVTEELVRSRSHLQQFSAVLDGAGSGQAVGRRLDFLLQEMGRETNTIGSKGNDSDIAHLVVDLKTELERIREQVQNVE